MSCLYLRYSHCIFKINKQLNVLKSRVKISREELIIFHVSSVCDYNFTINAIIII